MLKKLTDLQTKIVVQHTKACDSRLALKQGARQYKRTLENKVTAYMMPLVSFSTGLLTGLVLIKAPCQQGESRSKKSLTGYVFPLISLVNVFASGKQSVMQAMNENQL